jgi:thioredoxin-like negative regulator of GroEL
MIYNQLASRRAVGKSAGKLAERIPGLDRTDKALIYCYSPNCPPCRNMMPHIEKLAEETGKVFKLDISHNMELAHEIGIRATPTTLVVARGEFRMVLVGMKIRGLLKEMLESTA